MAKVRWYHLVCLSVLLVIGAFLRLKNITRYSIWRDESWAVYLATGRGDTLFNIPFQTVVTSPPNVGFESAPHWWHIWNTLDSVAHPPGYYIVLRWWIDLFGQGDLSIRGMSVLCGLAGVVVLFDALRLSHEPWPALAGAAIMTFAPIQIDFSQQARPYTFVTLIGLLIYDILLRIEKRGVSRLKLIGMAALVMTAVLTHYFAMGIIAGAGVYALVRMKGVARRQTLMVIVGAVSLSAIVWTPFIARSRGAFHNSMGVTDPNSSLVRSTLDAPQRLVFDNPGRGNWLADLALAALIFLLPLLNRRKLIWWLWVAMSFGCVLAVDLTRHSVVMEIDRYIFFASAGVYALLALPLPGKIGWLVPAMVVAGAIIAGLARFQSGPRYALASVYMWEEDRYSANFLREHLKPGDAVVLTTNIITYAEFTYFATAHYNGQWNVPVVLLRNPLDDRLRNQLFSYNRVWVVGQEPVGDTRRLLPGCQIIYAGGAVAYDSVWRIK